MYVLFFSVQCTLALAEDFIYDYPKFWEYMATLFCEYIRPPFDDLYSFSSVALQRSARVSGGWPLFDNDSTLYTELKTALLRSPYQESQYVIDEMDKKKLTQRDHIDGALSPAVNTEDCDNVFQRINVKILNDGSRLDLNLSLVTHCGCERHPFR